MTSEYKVDRAGWMAGPWDGEPDRLDWHDEATGLRCMMLRGGFHGAWCGYVALPEGHPLRGVDRDKVPATVHGGVTCASDLRQRDAWWIGFDASHSFDFKPGYTKDGSAWCDETAAREDYRDVAYVRAEVTKLAAQLAAVTA